MRATISFEANVSRVNDVMRSLVLEESNALQEALLSLERATADRIVEGISEALEHIHGVVQQLEQYQQMMIWFEKARFETIIPQPITNEHDLNQAKESMKKLDSFLDRIREEDSSDEPQEG